MLEQVFSFQWQECRGWGALYSFHKMVRLQNLNSWLLTVPYPLVANPVTSSSCTIYFIKLLPFDSTEEDDSVKIVLSKISSTEEWVIFPTTGGSGTKSDKSIAETK